MLNGDERRWENEHNRFFSLNLMNWGFPLVNKLLIPEKGTGDMRPSGGLGDGQCHVGQRDDRYTMDEKKNCRLSFDQRAPQCQFRGSARLLGHITQIDTYHNAWVIFRPSPAPSAW